MRPLEKTVVVRDKRFLLRVETSDVPQDYAKYEALREEVWGFPDDHLSSNRNMMCENVVNRGSSLFIGVFAEAGEAGYFETDGEHLVGFCYGFVGLRDAAIGFREASNLRFYAQYAGVRKAYAGYGLGILLKEYQREIVLDLLGVSTIVCTFDPMTGVNAHRNIRYFGMDVLEYRVAAHGEFGGLSGGLLNRPDVPTDRFVTSWDLTRTAARPVYSLEKALDAAPVIRVGLRTVAGRSGPLELEVVEGTEPQAAGDVVLVRIPLDLYRMLQETDVADPAVKRIPVDWRMATREAFTSLLARGFRVVDFLKPAEGRPGSSYVLLRTGGTAR